LVGKQVAQLWSAGQLPTPPPLPNRTSVGAAYSFGFGPNGGFGAWWLCPPSVRRRSLAGALDASFQNEVKEG